MGITFPTAIIFTSEVVKSSHRETGPVLINLACSFAEIGVATLSYLTLTTIGWRWFIIMCAAPLLPCFLLLALVIPESPRYLIASGKDEDARKAVEWMAKMNKVELPENKSIIVHQDQDLGAISELFKPKYRKETVLLSIIFFGMLLIMFGSVLFIPLALYSDFCGASAGAPKHECIHIKKESLLQLVLVTTGSVFGLLAGFFLAKKIGRSISLKIMSILNLCTILLLFKCFSQFGTVITFLFVKFFASGTNMITLIIVPELYPTSFRNAAMGFINSCGKFGGAIGAGLVYFLFYISPYYVLGMLAGAALLVVLCSLLYNKETKDVTLQDVSDPR